MEQGPVRVCTVGQVGAGKSTALNVTTGQWPDDTDRPTVGIELQAFRRHGRRVELWDTSGQERYQALTPQYVRRAHLLLICVDVQRGESSALADLQRYLTMSEGSQARSKALLVTKCDDLRRPVWLLLELEARRAGLVLYYTSALRRPDELARCVLAEIDLVPPVIAAAPSAPLDSAWHPRTNWDACGC